MVFVISAIVYIVLCALFYKYSAEIKAFLRIKPEMETQEEYVDGLSGEQNSVHNQEDSIADKTNIAKTREKGICQLTFSEEEIDATDTPKVKHEYQYPSEDLLSTHCASRDIDTSLFLGKQVEDYYNEQGLTCALVDVQALYDRTVFLLSAAKGIHVAGYKKHTDDLRLILAVENVEICIPYPGTSCVGVVSYDRNDKLYLRDIVKSDKFRNSCDGGSFSVGANPMTGVYKFSSFSKIGHLLIAGATGSGKSTYIDTIIISLLYKESPEKLGFIFIDSLRGHFSIYKSLPHTVYYGMRSLISLDSVMEIIADSGFKRRIIIFVDDYADLKEKLGDTVDKVMFTLLKEGQQLGIHLVISVQRPTVNVMPGNIKALIDNRITFRMAASVDSVTVIGEAGAEHLKEQEMLVQVERTGTEKYISPYISELDLTDVIEFIKEKNPRNMYYKEEADCIPNSKPEFDELVYEAGLCIIEKNKVSLGMLQREFRIGFNRACKLMEELENLGVVSSENGTKPREILIGVEEYKKLFK